MNDYSDDEVEKHMKKFFGMRLELDKAQELVVKLRNELFEARAESAIHRGRNLDLERENRKLLVTYTKMQSLLSTVGGLGDMLSLNVAELQALAKGDPDMPRELESPEPQKQLPPAANIEPARDLLKPDEIEELERLAKKLAPRSQT